jgi:hypothetical protein
MIRAAAVGMLNSIAPVTGTTYCLGPDLPVHPRGEAPRDCQVCHDVYVGGEDETPGK